MLSRVADSLYWMSRYLERAEHTARLVNVNPNLTLDRAPADAARHWGRLLASLPDPPTWQIRATPDVVDYAEHAWGQGSEARAVAYIETKNGDGRVPWGVGTDPSTITAAKPNRMKPCQYHGSSFQFKITMKSGSTGLP